MANRKNILNITANKMKSKLETIGFVVRIVLNSKIRKLAKDSKKRGDDPLIDSEVMLTTTAQNNFWAQEMIFQNTSNATIAGALIIDEPINTEVFRQAVNTARKHNDGMRIRFLQADGNLIQYATAYKPLTTQLLSFANEEELKNYCDSEKSKPYYGIVDKDLSNEIEIFCFPDGKGGFLVREHHIRTDGIALPLFGLAVLLVYEKLIRGRTHYKGLITSFIDYAKNHQAVSGSLDVDYQEQVDSSSHRITYTLDEEIVSKMQKVCEDIGRSAGLNIRPSKLFELSAAIEISLRNNAAEGITLNTLVTGRKIGTSEELTIGAFAYSKPVVIFLDWKGTVKENIINTKKRAKGLLETPHCSGCNDPSDTIWISYRPNDEITKKLIKTPFHLHESPREYSPVPLFMQIADVSGTGKTTVFYDVWKAVYSKEQIEQRHKTIMHIIDVITTSPDITLVELSAAF